MTASLLRKSLSALLAATIAAAPLGTASAQYVYRIPLAGVDALPPPGETGEPFSVGEYAGPYGFDRGAGASLPGPAVSGGATPYTFAAVSGLPQGMSVGAGGSVGGTPQAAGNYALVVRVRDGVGREQLRTVAIAVLEPTGSPLQAAFSSPEYAAIAGQAGIVPAPVVSGGNAPYAFSGGATGATVNAATGQVSFNFAAAGSYAIPVTVRDADNRTATSSVTVHASDPIAVASLGGPFYATVGETGTIGTASGTGGRGSLSFAPAPGSDLLQVSGTTVSHAAPTAPGTFSQAVRATDADGHSGTSPSFEIIAAHAPFTGLQATYGGTVGQTGTIPAPSPSAGEGPYVLTLTANPGNALTGHPATGMTYSLAAGTHGPFTVQVTDVRGRQRSQSFSIAVTQPLAISTYQSSYAGTGNIPGSIPAPTVTGGTAPYKFALNGAPAGVAIDADNGAISYSANAGTYPISVTVTDAAQRSIPSNTFNLVLGAPFALTYSQPAQLFANVQAEFTPIPSGGGAGPYSYQITSGSVPAGMNFSPTTGIVSGIPTGTAAGSFTVKATSFTATTEATHTVSYTVGAIDDTAIWAKVSGISSGGVFAQYHTSAAVSKAHLSDSNYANYVSGGLNFASLYYANNGASTANFTINFSSATTVSGMIIRINANSSTATTSFPVSIYRNGTKIGTFAIAANGFSNLVQSVHVPLGGSFNSLTVSYEAGVTPNGLQSTLSEIDFLP